MTPAIRQVARGGSPMQLRQTILIVDDNPINLVTLEDALMDGIDVTVITAESGKDAVVATQHHRFAVCILDVEMPGMGGYELAEVLKADEKTRFIPLLFLTARPREPDEMLRGYEVGAVDYLTRPYDRFVLVSKVKVFLELDSQRRQLEILLNERESKELTIRRQAEAIEIGQTEKMVALGRLTASVTHELNQPLNAMRIISGDILRDVQRGRLELDSLEEFMTEISDQITKMAKIVDHLRIYSRKVGEVERKSLHARAPLDGALRLLQHQMRIDDVQVIVSVDDGLRVEGDQVKLEQVFVNLINNASAAAQSGQGEDGSRVEVTLRAGERDDSEKAWAVFSIGDNGPGVPKDIEDQIFEPFVTGKKPGEGTGLGLSVSKQIVDAHGGHIEFDSGAATTFRVWLPLLDERNRTSG